jgi:predicted PurR-regulated permease PerM
MITDKGMRETKDSIFANVYPVGRVRDGVLVLLTALICYLCWLLAKPFLPAITWALALAVLVHPLHRWFDRKFHPNLAAVLSVFVVVVALLAPAAVVLQKLASEARQNLPVLDQLLAGSNVLETARRYPVLGALLGWMEARLDVAAEIQRALGSLTARVSGLLSGSLWAITQIVIMLVTLFYFLRDRRRLLHVLRQLLPLSSDETNVIFHRISQTISATVYGNVIVKLLQGLLTGLMFWILGLPAPVLFGVTAALLAVLPILGTSLVWGPAAIWLLIHGSWIKALILILWGMFLVSVIDNVLYPLMVASELRLPSLAIFFSVFGGLIAFGFAGVVLGPIVLAVASALLAVWQGRVQIEPEGQTIQGGIHAGARNHDSAGDFST